MALDTFVAGAYTGAWNSVAIGPTSEGYRVDQEVKNELIDSTDIWGMALVDMLYQGGGCTITCEGKTYKAGTTAPFWPYGGGTLGVLVTAAVPISVLASALAQSLVLTAVAATPAAMAPATLNATKAILAENVTQSLLFSNKLRTVPLKFRLLPVAGTPSSTLQWFTLT